MIEYINVLLNLIFQRVRDLLDKNMCSLVFDTFFCIYFRLNQSIKLHKSSQLLSKTVYTQTARNLVLYQNDLKITLRKKKKKRQLCKSNENPFLHTSPNIGHFRFNLADVF